MRRLEAVVFDFDGVLADSVPAYRAAVNDIISATGDRDPDPDLVATADTLTVAQRLKDHYGLEASVEALVGQIEANALDRLMTVYCVVPGARELVSSLRDAGIPLGVASLAPRKNIEGVLNQANLLNYFDTIVTVNDVVNIKPDPEIYLRAAEDLQADPANCVAIEDSDRGISSAKAAGMTVIGLTTTFEADRLAEADHIVPTLADTSLELFNKIFQNKYA